MRIRTHHKCSNSSFLSCLALRLVEFRLNLVVFKSPRLFRSIGMSLSLVLFCNTRSFVIDLSYSYLFLHDLSPAVSSIEFMISLLCYYMLCMIRQLALVQWYSSQYSEVCSSMVSDHLKGGGSARDTRVSLTNVDMVYGLIKCCWMSSFPTVCGGSLQMVTALFYGPPTYWVF